MSHEISGAAEMNPSAVPTVEDSTVLSAGQIVAGHRLVALIGRGGMAEVWRALDVHLDRHHAIKFLRSDVARHAHSRERFLREARAIARLNHPNIIQVHQASQEHNLVFTVMELVEGESLEQRLRRDKRLSPPLALAIIRQVVEGLRYANSKGIIHRDVKPGNILIARDGTIKIVDFGLAKIFAEETQRASTGASMGTPYYMSPETVYGKAMDHRSDMYSLGITFYRLLTGELPFYARRMVDVAAMHVHHPLPEPVTLLELANGAVLNIIKTMVAKKPDDRYPTYEELAQALADVVPLVGVGDIHAGPFDELSNTITQVSPRLLARRSPLTIALMVLLIGGIVLLLIDRKRSTKIDSAEPVGTAVAKQLPVLGASVDQDPTVGPKNPVAGGGDIPDDVAQVASMYGAGASEIISDDEQAGVVRQEPSGSWKSTKIEGSYRSSSLLTPCDGQMKSATFVADVPSNGKYEVFLSWVSAPAPQRAEKVVATVHTARGPFRGTLNQTLRRGASSGGFNSLGKYVLQAGSRPVVTLSTEGLDATHGMFVSADAVKLVQIAKLSGPEVPSTPAPSVQTPAPTPVPSPQAEISEKSPVIASPSLPPLTAAAPPTGGDATAEIIMDDAKTEYIRLEPKQGWQPSVNTSDSHGGGSKLAPVDGKPKTATFLADIPSSRNYELLLHWVPSVAEFRSKGVPVRVHAKDGEKILEIDQVAPRNRHNFVKIGTFAFNQGPKTPVVTISTEGVEPYGVFVSVDAAKLIPVQ